MKVESKDWRVEEIPEIQQGQGLRLTITLEISEGRLDERGERRRGLEISEGGTTGQEGVSWWAATEAQGTRNFSLEFRLVWDLSLRDQSTLYGLISPLSLSLSLSTLESETTKNLKAREKS
jgi:hypothetical protein